MEDDLIIDSSSDGEPDNLALDNSDLLSDDENPDTLRESKDFGV